MIVGCYTLNLYCDRSGYSDPSGNSCPRDKSLSPIGEFIGPNRTKAIAEAQREGWLVKDAEDVCLCPQCRRDYNARLAEQPAPAGARSDGGEGLRKAAENVLAIWDDTSDVPWMVNVDKRMEALRAALDGASGQEGR